MKQLIVFSGLPGTGKSSIADPVGRELAIPVFAKDWLEAALLESGWEKSNLDLVRFTGYELLTILARRQLTLGQSAILDCVVGLERTRSAWRKLAATHDAAWRVVECVCSDKDLHQARVNKRHPTVPHRDKLLWRDVERVRAYYDPWTDERLILDSAKPLADNIQRTLEYLTSHQIEEKSFGD